MFERLDTDTAEIEKRSIDIESMATKKTADPTDPVVAYMRNCQELSRALSMKYRKQLAFNNSVESVEEATEELRTSNSYGYEYAKNRGKRAIEQMEKASKESQSAIIDLGRAAEKLKESRSKLAQVLPEDTLVPLKELDPLVLTEEDRAKIDEMKPKPKT